MQIVEQSSRILMYTPVSLIESGGRVCYQSTSSSPDEEKRTEQFVARIVKNKHESVLEHSLMTVRFVTDIGTARELLRHRHLSPSQESTRYVKYKNIQFIKPYWYGISWKRDLIWKCSMKLSEIGYRLMLKFGATPEMARDILPLATKTELIVTGNYRTWKHIIDLRFKGTTGRPHPQIKELIGGLKFPTSIKNLMTGELND